ncbi:MAG: hypothetical protein ACYCU0_06625 [Solirubrobacteraceae bacterium]
MHRPAVRRRRATAAAATLLASVSLTACGGASKPAGTSTTGSGTSSASALGPATQNRVYRKALIEYAGCLRRHGVDVPNPKQGGRAKLDTSGIDKSSARFKQAALSCAATLDEALRKAAARAYAGKHASGKG